MRKNEITTTQVNWIITALNHDIASIRDEIDHAEDGSPITAIGEILMDERTALVTKLTDMIANGCKTIRLI